MERSQNGKKSVEGGRRKVKGSGGVGKEGKGKTRRGKVGEIIDLEEALQEKKERKIVSGYLGYKKAVWAYRLDGGGGGDETYKKGGKGQTDIGNSAVENRRDTLDRSSLHILF
jgi:hypothetical protein